MSSRRFEWNKTIAAATCATLFATSAPARADDGFRYFADPEIDYWRTGARDTHETKPVAALEKKPTLPSAASNSKGFAWEKYLNPNNDDFFREGEYTPPAPFVEIARNPTDENISRWYQYIETKNELLRRLQARLTEYAQRNPGKIAALPAPYSTALADDPNVLATAAARMPKTTALAADAKRYRLRLYFDSHCPHCQRMLGTMSELASMGFFVELRQVDQDRSVRAKIPFPVTDASTQEMKSYGIDAVPVLLVGDLKKKTFVKLPGFQPTSAVLKSIGG